MYESKTGLPASVREPSQVVSFKRQHNCLSLGSLRHLEKTSWYLEAIGTESALYGEPMKWMSVATLSRRSLTRGSRMLGVKRLPCPWPLDNANACLAHSGPVGFSCPWQFQFGTSLLGLLQSW